MSCNSCNHRTPMYYPHLGCEPRCGHRHHHSCDILVGNGAPLPDLRPLNNNFPLYFDVSTTPIGIYMFTGAGWRSAGTITAYNLPTMTSGLNGAGTLGGARIHNDSAIKINSLGELYLDSGRAAQQLGPIVHGISAGSGISVAETSAGSGIFTISTTGSGSGGGGLTTVAVNSPLTGNGTGAAPIGVDVNALATALENAGHHFASSGGGSAYNGIGTVYIIGTSTPAPSGAVWGVVDLPDGTYHTFSPGGATFTVANKAVSSSSPYTWDNSGQGTGAMRMYPVPVYNSTGASVGTIIALEYQTAANI